MIKTIRACLRAALFLAPPALAHPSLALAEWKATETVQTYAISGKTAPELYASIGARGPGSGASGRAIAHTTFKLTWTRKYEPRGNTCVLAVARPKLNIIYVLPKPAEKLPPATRENWQRFITGVQTHERVHGDHITDMVKEIEALSVGFTVDNDPGCKKIRGELTRHLGELSLKQRQRSRDFDQVELSPGGNVHQLILAFVNGA